MRPFVCSLILCLGLACSGQSSEKPPLADAGGDNPQYLWDDIQRDWLQTEYGPCLKEAGLRMGCGGCPAIMINADFQVGQDGRLRGTRITRENVCGGKASPALKRCFFKFFERNLFPVPLRGQTLKGKLGTGLAC